MSKHVITISRTTVVNLDGSTFFFSNCKRLPFLSSRMHVNTNSKFGKGRRSYYKFSSEEYIRSYSDTVFSLYLIW